MADPRERRDELLLDLGALVFELHRQGRRAPELLTAKAAELDALDRGQPAEEAEAECPRCGAAAHAEQLVCLECGGRIALDAHPLEEAAWAAVARVEAEREGGASAATSEPPSTANGEAPAREAPALAVWNGVPGAYAPPVAIPVPRQRWWPRALGGIAVAVGVAAATLLLLLALDGSGTDAPSREARLGATPPPARPRAVDTPARPVRRGQHAGGVPTWRDGSAYTVVLLTTGDAGSARRAAERLGGQGVRAGVVRNGGFWLVFSGRYEDQSAAYAAATRLRGKLGAAYAQFIER